MIAPIVYCAPLLFYILWIECKPFALFLSVACVPCIMLFCCRRPIMRVLHQALCIYHHHRHHRHHTSSERATPPDFQRRKNTPNTTPINQHNWSNKKKEETENHKQKKNRMYLSVGIVSCCACNTMCALSVDPFASCLDSILLLLSQLSAPPSGVHLASLWTFFLNFLL